MNVLNYIEEYGNLSFDDYSFNEIDAMILALISYLKFENLPISLEDNMILFKDLYPYYDLLKIDDRYDMLCMELSNSLRYSNLSVGYFVNQISKDMDQQFSAITTTFDQDTYNIVFRGTDTSIVGWKEDFNLSFMENITSHKTALKYFDYIQSICKGKYRLIGHSKGGNIALYTSIMTNHYNDLIHIYNFDGPSFIPGKVDTNKVALIHKKFVPQCSMIGLLMEENSNFTIVESDAKNIMQHDLFSWKIEDGKLITKNELDKMAIYFQKTINEWLLHASLEKRELYINTIFDLFSKENVDCFSEMNIKNYSSLIKNYQSLDNDLKEFMQQITHLLFQANLNQTKEVLNANKEEFIEKIKQNIPHKK